MGIATHLITLPTLPTPGFGGQSGRKTKLLGNWPATLSVLLLLSAGLVGDAAAGQRFRGIGDDPFAPSAGVPLVPIEGRSVHALSTTFSRLDYHWPVAAGDQVPPISVTSLPVDLKQERDIKHRKGIFFRSLLPIVLAENKLLLAQRAHVARMLTKGLPRAGTREYARLGEVIAHYKLQGKPDDPETVRKLLNRLDAAPVGVVLAQAANESAWGTSRFAQRAHNLFGIWTYKPAEGIVPKKRAPGQKHLIRRYDSLRDSVRSYLYNINVGHAYAALRRQRAAMRARGERLDSLRLAAGLSKYSERGAAYVKEIRAMIRVNKLNDLQTVEFRPANADRLASTIASPSPDN